ncbi:MAG TPA: dephospho-CoA kinase [Opitutaceae bacterium]|nr:dephospho-CoA kinase [Opitutaceae bacterium]
MDPKTPSPAAAAAASAGREQPPPDWPRPRLVLGLSGGMGCGKSTATRFFGECGFQTVDCDRIVREELLPRPDIVAAIAARFGAGVLDGDARLNRAAVAERVFARDEDRLWLEALLHPEVRASWRAALASDLAARWVVEVPLLFEKRLENWFDSTVCVATSSGQQLSRLQARGVPPDLAAARIAKQLPLPRKIAAADFVLLNDGSLDFLKEQVASLAGRWL